MGQEAHLTNLAFQMFQVCHDYGYTDLDAPQPGCLRAFKTHCWYRDCPKGAGKYIYVMRGE